MPAHDDYSRNGYVRLERLVPGELAKALLDHFWRSLHGGQLPVAYQDNPVLPRPALDLHGSNFPTIATFHWGMTPVMAGLAGCELLPAFAFFRLYKQGDTLRVHHDREACEHSMTLTLGYSDGQAWPFDVGTGAWTGRAEPTEDFGQRPFTSVAMHPGDAVASRGIERPPGRLAANPNQWSAHLFLHWVERDGPYRDQAFEGWS